MQQRRTGSSASSFHSSWLAIVMLARLIQTYLGCVVTCGHQTVIPKSLQERVISICHYGHLGILLKVNSFSTLKVWLSGIYMSVERRIASCIPCQASINTSQREPLKMSPTPNGQWQEASAEFCGPFPTGEMVLVVLHAYLKYPEVEIVSSTAAGNALPALERIFATGKDWRRELQVFFANYKATLHPSTGKSPYQLRMN